MAALTTVRPNQTQYLRERLSHNDRSAFIACLHRIQRVTRVMIAETTPAKRKGASLAKVEAAR